jgi:hypothetical protein
MITKIKRYLAKIGIGNPLNMLVYDDKEIKNMNLNNYIKKEKKPNKFSPTNKGKFGVMSGNIIVHVSFNTKTEAEKWAKWNYKDNGGYKVIYFD